MIRLARRAVRPGEQLPPDILKNIAAKYHLDDPLHIQYARYMGSLLKLDLGPSYRYANRTVNEIIAESFGFG